MAELTYAGVGTPLAAPARVARRWTWRSGLRAAWRLRAPVAGTLVVLVITVLCVGAPLFTRYNPYEGEVIDRLLPPAWMRGGERAHPLGTDEVGRDLWTRLLYGGRVSLAAGVLATLIATAIGVSLGLVGGFYGGKVDAVVSTIVNIFMTFPYILLALAVIAVLGPSFANLVLVMGIASWPIYTRVVRAEVMRLREMEFVRAATVLGGGDSRILTRHIFPNLVSSVIVIGTIQVARLIIFEAFLSFLGLGVQPPEPSWGSMLGDSRAFMFDKWWMPTFPGAAIFITSLAINLMGDGLRDILDPHSRTNL